MPRPIRISPSILSADFGHLARDVAAVTEAGADYIHVDVMDGHYVPNLTIGPQVVEAIRQATKLPLDVHLMISNAEQFIDRYVDAGADLLIVHAEACTHLHRALQQIRERGAKPCVSLNPATPLDAIEHVLGDVDMVLLMTVNPGFGGQAFIESMLHKISALQQAISARDLDVDIEVDGGIKVENVDRVVAAGANVIVSGSGIFGKGDYRATISEMRARAERARG